MLGISESMNQRGN